MKLKYLYLGLLSTLVVTGQAEAMMKQTHEVPLMQQKLEEHKQVKGRVKPLLDTATHGDMEGAIAHIDTILGRVTRGAVAQGVGLPIVHGAVNVADLMPTANERLEAILVRLKAGVAHQRAQGVAMESITNTKTTNTAAGALQAGDYAAIAGAGCNNIEDLLAELGW